MHTRVLIDWKVKAAFDFPVGHVSISPQTSDQEFAICCEIAPLLLSPNPVPITTHGLTATLPFAWEDSAVADIESVAVIGAGTMGSGIAHVFARVRDFQSSFMRRGAAVPRSARGSAPSAPTLAAKWRRASLQEAREIETNRIQPHYRQRNHGVPFHRTARR